MTNYKRNVYKKRWENESCIVTVKQTSHRKLVVCRFKTKVCETVKNRNLSTHI